MNNNILNVLLSMDAYNRGYDQGVRLATNEDGESSGIYLGNFKITKESDLRDISSSVKAGFYALSYDTNNDGKADIVSYRGTDTPPQIETALNLKDLALLFVNNTVGSLFYKDVVGADNVLSADVSTTGHSLDGGLVCLVAANDNFVHIRKAV